ncbi:MAG: ABC transporter ATP-binding protein [Candidatus Eremiobacteraeota bacterium]|nr:ABC transporter ATP-binding protein [Candidatus Eremiobacteraeota bacterium]
MLEIRNLSFAYPGRAELLSQLECSWKAGETIGLIGPNGSGKSTLLRVLAGLLPYQGSVQFENLELSAQPAGWRASRLSYLPQQLGFDQPFRAAEVVMMGQFHRLDRWGGGGSSELVHQCLERVGAGHLADRVVTRLSGGELQRVRLAQALAQDAQAWLLDEPTSAMDLHQQLELMELFRELREQGKSLLIVLHDLNLARRLCSQVWVMDAGRLLVKGSPEEVFASPQFEKIFQVQMEVFRDKNGDSVLWPKKLTHFESSDTL